MSENCVMMNEKLKSIDFSALNEKINEQLGINPVLETTVIETVRGEEYITVKNTKELDAGLFGKVLKAFIISGTGKITKEGDAFWLPLDFRYKHMDGGANGTSIGTARYTFETKTWIYKPVGKDD